jgi:hypothetical protein
MAPPTASPFAIASLNVPANLATNWFIYCLSPISRKRTCAEALIHLREEMR